MFSVVIPLFNNAHTIERALKSVFNQTFTNFEIIIIDSESTDNGIEIINKLTNDIRLKIIKQKNQGISVARNTGEGISVARNQGVRNAQYEYIAFLDADDKWESKYLETIHKAIKLHPNCGMVCCANYYKDDITKNKSLRIAERFFEKYKGRFTEINYFENPHVFSHTSSTVIEKNIFNKVGGFPEELINNEDFALFFFIALIKPTVYCGFPLSYYYGNIKGQSTARNAANFYKTSLDVCRRFNLTYKLWNSRGRSNEIFIVFLKYEFRHIIFWALKQNDFDEIKLILEIIDNDILKLFPFLEIKFYEIHSLKNWNKFYIYITKLFWRTRGYPRVR